MNRVETGLTSQPAAVHDRCALVVASRRWFREGLKGLLQTSDIASLFDAATLDEGLAALNGGESPVVVIVSLEGDDGQVRRGLETISAWRDRLAQTKWVVLCPAPKPAILIAALRSGVDGLFHVDISEDVLRRAVELVMLGQVLFPAELTQVVLTALQPDSVLSPGKSAGSTPQQGSDHEFAEQVPLSPREHQILQCLVAGHPNKVIARELDIAEATVKVHIKGLLRKVKATNRTQAAIWAMNQRPLPRPSNIVKLPPTPPSLSAAETCAPGVLPRSGYPLSVGLAGD